MAMVRWLLLPWWVIEIFTGGKSFRDNPILGSRTLNRLGLHVARLVVGHGLTRLRHLMLAPLVPAEQRQAYRRDGFVVLENFLPPEQFARLGAEIRACHGERCTGEVRECVQGDTLTLMMMLDGKALGAMPETAALIADRRLGRLAMYVGSRLKRPLYFLHVVKNSFVPGGGDPQKEFHSDTFHSTMKGWYFVEDVRPEHGPFTYVPGSHRLTAGRLRWEYQQSIAASDSANRYASKGSLRLDEADIAAMGYRPPVAMAVKANTLVIADTHGFHRRGDAKAGASRLAVYLSSRSNPFNPLPGFAPTLTGWLEAEALKAYWRAMDRKAERTGGQASWHVVASGKLHARAAKR
jgi:hypothetical protein